MNKLITFAVVLLAITFGISQSQSKATLETLNVEKPVSFDDYTVNHEDYTVHFSLEKIKGKKHTLIIEMGLQNDSYYISPNAKRDFKGKFYMDLGSYTHLVFDGDIIETPLSIEEYDPHPFTNGLVNWVRVNTTYKQPLQIKSQEDFVVFGRLQFTIEPRCTFEEIPFAISYQDRVMKFIEPKC